ncbi:transcriptional regulator [Lysinibacillus alkalisoli]|uniref:Transcriptional regulator n=1 Tax=Lysinibacillus alkalisoli TaxID=1911548 RepID=A0A917G855_9BACI|nr:transcription repressor NadR [Lysinibacillus alkalisoli]GGG27452.1 transcriptional regulator [Lysinibacillus alkalisoli]
MTKKLLGEQRRAKIMELLREADTPITGTALAKVANVSRQVIVTDMTLLKARNEPILATSQGYVYMPKESTPLYERIVACQHTPAQTEEELFAIVDCGVMVKNVIIEHGVYGDLTASIHVSNRLEVKQFLQKVAEEQAMYLSALTDGTHLHTLVAPTTAMLDCAEQALRDSGFLIEN